MERPMNTTEESQKIAQFLQEKGNELDVLIARVDLSNVSDAEIIDALIATVDVSGEIIERLKPFTTKLVKRALELEKELNRYKEAAKNAKLLPH